jgi:hypothetical protein
MNAMLFSFQDLKLSTKDIIAVLKDTNQVLYWSLIHMLQGSHSTPWRDIRLVHVLEIAFVIWSLVLAWLNQWALILLTLHSHRKKELRILHLWICYSSKALWIAIFSTKSFIHFQRLCLVRELPSTPKLPLLTILNQQSRWEDIHPNWYFLIHVPN